MSFGFLGRISQDVSSAVHNVSQPQKGVFGFLQQATHTIEQPLTLVPKLIANSNINAAKAVAGEVTGNKQATQNAVQGLKQSYAPTLNLVQSTARTVPEAVTSLAGTQQTYHPGSQIEKAIFGPTPIQNIEANVASNYNAHSNLNPIERVGLAGADLAGQVAQTAPVGFGFLKGLKVGADLTQAAKEAEITNEVPRATLKDQQVLKDFVDYRVGAYKPPLGEVNKILADAREVGAKHNIDLINGTNKSQVEDATSILDQIGKDRKAANQGGFVALPSKGVPENIHEIQTPIGTLRIGENELNKLSEAKSPAEVKQVIGNSLPENVTNRLSQVLPHTQDPNIIKNIISRELSPSPALPSVGAEITPPSVEGAVNPAGQGALDNLGQSEAAKQITNTLAEAQKTRALQEQGYIQERSARINASQGAGKDLQGSQGYAAELAQLKGPLEKQDYSGLSGHLSPTEQEDLFSKLRQEVKDNPNIQGFADVNTQTALRKVIFGEGGVPTNSELGLLKNAFGDNFSNAVKEDVADHNERLNAFKTFGQKLGEVAGVPRTIMASADFSGGLRQGLALATRHPIMFAQEFGKQFKYAFSEKEYEAANQMITEHPDYQLLRQAKVAIQDIGDKPVTAKEEQFVSNLAEKIPVIGRVVHGSNRAYTGLLNNLRARSFYNLVSSARNAGVDFNDVSNGKLLKDFGTVVNTSTGRGNLGRFEAAGNALSTALFAPRLIASRLSMLDPRYYINLEPAARREALTTLASLGAVTTTVLGLAEMAGAKVSHNPTSADFGKIKIGDTRLDVLGGYQQYLRLAAQLATGKSTNSTTGATTELGKGIAASRWDVFTNFLTNKEAPVPSFVTTALKGKDAAGNPINYKKEVLDRFTPLLAQDIQDLYTHDNAVGGNSVGKPLAAVGGALGVGLQTYSAQDSPLSAKQTTYIKTLKDQGADSGTIKASTSFFQNLKQASGTKTNVNSAVDKALADKDLPKAQQLADQYNKDLAQGMTKWAQQYGEQYGNETLQEAYNKQKINLTPSSLQSRLKSLNSTKPF